MMGILEYAFILAAIGWGVSFNHMLKTSKKSHYYFYSIILFIIYLVKTGVI